MASCTPRHSSHGNLCCCMLGTPQRRQESYVHVLVLCIGSCRGSYSLSFEPPSFRLGTNRQRLAYTPVQPAVFRTSGVNPLCWYWAISAITCAAF